MAKTSKRLYLIPVLFKALDILELLQAEGQPMTLEQIHRRTKISKTHLHALEEEAYDQLPAVVYVRGFVTELAKYLRLDPAHVQRTYMRRMRERPLP